MDRICYFALALLARLLPHTATLAPVFFLELFAFLQQAFRLAFFFLIRFSGNVCLVLFLLAQRLEISERSIDLI